MKSKKAISRSFFLIYILTLAFSVIYAGLFLTIGCLVAFSGYWMIEIYLIPAFLGSLAILGALVPRLQIKKSPGVLYDEPGLARTVSLLAKTMGIDCPARIQVLYEMNALAFRDGKQDRLGLGLPLVVLMDHPELATIIAHELAHHFQGDLKYGKNIARVEAVFTRLMRGLDNRWANIIAGPYMLVAKRLFKTIRQLSRQNEFNADRLAADLVGTDASIQALRKLEIYREAWELFLADWLWHIRQSGLGIDIVAGFKTFLAANQPLFAERQVAELPAQRYDTHPSIHERIQELKAEPVANPNLVHLEEWTLDGSRHSAEFWPLYDKAQDKVSQEIFLEMDIRAAFQSYGRDLVTRYGGVFGETTFGEAVRINFIFGDISFRLYQITQIDQYEFERELVTRILSFLLFEQFHPDGWLIGPHFTPIIKVGEAVLDLHSIISQNFGNQPQAWQEMMNSLQLQPDDRILARAS